MTYRSVLVEVDGESGSVSRIDAAARIASDNDASLTGVMPGVMMAEGIVAPVVATDAFLQESRALIAAASSKVRAPFDAEVARRNLGTTWTPLNGDYPHALVAQARRHDLTIVPCRMKAGVRQQRDPRRTRGDAQRRPCSGHTGVGISGHVRPNDPGWMEGVPRGGARAARCVAIPRSRSLLNHPPTPTLFSH